MFVIESNLSQRPSHQPVPLAPELRKPAVLLKLWKLVIDGDIKNMLQSSQPSGMRQRSKCVAPANSLAPWHCGSTTLCHATIVQGSRSS
jgi:hypothetical protein